VAEVVRDGVGGHVFETLDALVEGLQKVYDLDRAAVRRHVVENFDVVRMVDQYERLYLKVTNRI
jgi:glycosyltransferase involved in cell wall biosynthesis